MPLLGLVCTGTTLAAHCGVFHNSFELSSCYLRLSMLNHLCCILFLRQLLDLVFLLLPTLILNDLWRSRFSNHSFSLLLHIEHYDLMASATFLLPLHTILGLFSLSFSCTFTVHTQEHTKFASCPLCHATPLPPACTSCAPCTLFIHSWNCSSLCLPGLEGILCLIVFHHCSFILCLLPLLSAILVSSFVNS